MNSGGVWVPVLAGANPWPDMRQRGPADLFFVARTRDDLIRAADAAEQLGAPWHIVGSVSNLLVADEGVEGLVIKAAANGVRVMADGDQPIVEAEAGCLYAALARQ